VRHLAAGLKDASLWTIIDDAASALMPLEQAARKLSESYRVVSASIPRSVPDPVDRAPARGLDRVAFVDATAAHGTYDRTLLLMLGQERAKVAIILDQDTLCLAARFDSNVSFLSLLELSGGMPTLVSIGKDRLGEVWQRLGVASADAPA
jgi:hypothetical protein